MNTSKQEVFVYGKIPFKESSELIYAISKNGRCTFISQGLKKETNKNKLVCEIGSYAFVELSGKATIPRLLNAKVLNHSLSNNYIELIIVQLICDLIKKSEFNDFNTIKFMQKLSGFHKLLYFLYHYCCLNGIMLNISTCVRTHAKTNFVAVSIKDGGIVSQDGLQMLDNVLSKSQMINIRIIERVNDNTLEKYKLLPVDYISCKVFLDLIEYHLGIKSKLQIFLEEE